MSNENQQIELQRPGEVRKPAICTLHIPTMIKSLYGLDVTSFEEFDSYDDRNYHVIVSSQSDNKYIPEPASDGYVFKILNAAESQRPQVIEAQHALLDHIRLKDIPAQEPMKNIRGETMSLEKIYDTEVVHETTPFQLCVVRLVSFIPGEIFYKTPYLPLSFYNVGRFVARLHNAFQGFHHSFYDTYNILWSLSEVKRLEEFIHAVRDERDRRLVKEVIEVFTTDVPSTYDKLTKGLIHGDINEQNIIVKECEGQGHVLPTERPCDVRGLIDFNDATYSYMIFDVGICIAYMCIECKLIDQRDVGGHVLAGYLSERNLNEAERSVLKLCVCGRLTQTLVMGAHTHYMDPSNTYALTTSKRGWPLLHLLWNTPTEDLNNRWNKIIENYKL